MQFAQHAQATMRPIPLQSIARLLKLPTAQRRNPPFQDFWFHKFTMINPLLSLVSHTSRHVHRLALPFAPRLAQPWITNLRVADSSQWLTAGNVLSLWILAETLAALVVCTAKTSSPRKLRTSMNPKRSCLTLANWFHFSVT
jgi:hypothetical protein